MKTFDSKSTTEDVLAGVDLTGKRAFVTGASAGLGVETVRALAARGAHVVGAARNLDKARRAIAAAQAEAGSGGTIELVELDLTDLASVRRAADQQIAADQPYDLLIANAGVMACPKGTTTDGFETQFGTNHLGHFVLVNRMAPLLRRGARVVMLSSSGHRFSDVDLDDPNFAHTPYEPFVAYGRSKTANILFAVELDRRLRERGVRATAVHPGGIMTELGRHLDPAVIEGMLEQMRARGEAFSWKSIPQGAATSVWAGVVAPAEAVGGRYCEDCHVAELTEGVDPTVARAGVRPYALDPDRARALWTKSEVMVGERF